MNQSQNLSLQVNCKSIYHLNPRFKEQLSVHVACINYFLKSETETQHLTHKHWENRFLTTEYFQKRQKHKDKSKNSKLQDKYLKQTFSKRCCIQILAREEEFWLGYIAAMKTRLLNAWAFLVLQNLGGGCRFCLPPPPPLNYNFFIIDAKQRNFVQLLTSTNSTFLRYVF